MEISNSARTFITILFTALVVVLFSKCVGDGGEQACPPDIGPPQQTGIKECSELEAEIIPGQYVIRIPDSPKAHTTDPTEQPSYPPVVDSTYRNRYEVLIDALNDSLIARGLNPDTDYSYEFCPCSNSILLLKIEDLDKDPGLETIRDVAETDPHEEGKGKADKNKRFIFDDFEDFGFNYESVDSLKGDTLGPHLTNKVKVGIVDSGIDFNHPEFEPYNQPYIYVASEDRLSCKDTFGFDFGLETIHPFRPHDGSGHGTAVKGIVSHNQDPERFVIIPAKITRENEIRLSDALCGIKYEIMQEVDILNLSWGYYGALDETFLAIMQEAKEQDILVVASAGNNAVNINNCDHWPSNFVAEGFDNIISVTALDASKTKLNPEFSNWGPTTVTIASPGTEVRTTTLILDGSYGNFNGTSMSAAFVTQKALQYKVANPELTPSQIIEKIIINADLFCNNSIITDSKLIDVSER